MPQVKEGPILSYLSIYRIGLHRQSEAIDEVAKIFSQSALLSPLGWRLSSSQLSYAWTMLAAV